jgi:hypothetical protein
MITLLDGETWEHDKILKKMDDDEFYFGHLKTRALSSSSAKLLLKSPKAYKFAMNYGTEDTPALRAGSLFHWAILEPDVFEKQIFVDVQSRNTKKFKEAKEEHGRVFTIKEKHDAERLADHFLRNEHAMRLIQDSEFEVAAIGTLPDIDFPFRGKADVLGKNRIVDLKTTADIRAFEISAKRKYHYDMQCYIYSHLFDIDYRNFTFCVIDKATLDIGIWDCSEEFYLEGKRKVEQAINVYNQFFIKNHDIDSYCLTGTL